MANLSEDTVDINAVHFRDIHSTVSFSSKSDALFAALVVKYPSLPSFIIDDLLSLLQNVSFLTNDVTFKCAEDIPDRIAKERRILASARETKQHRLSPVNSKVTSGTPMVLVELIAEQVRSERGAFVDMCRKPGRFVLSKLEGPDKTLRNMSLVHRSWTRTAQRCLRRRIVALSRYELKRLFKSPQLGPWVQELAFHERECRIFEQLRSSEVERLLCGILQRCPNLKRLYIEVEQLPIVSATATSSYHIPQQLSHLLSLESFWLRQYTSIKSQSSPEAVNNFMDLCTAISKLQELKSINISSLGFHVSTDPVDVSAHCNITPIASLPHLNIRTKTLSEVAPMSQPIQPRNTFRPSFLDINFELLKTFVLEREEMMSSITKLRVRVKIDALEELSRVLEHCRSLSLISLHIVGHDLIDEIHPILPTTVSVLSVYFDSASHAEISADLEASFLIPMLIRSSHLQEIAIYASAPALGMYYNQLGIKPYLETESLTIPYHATQYYCGENDMDFKLIVTEHSPSFLGYTNYDDFDYILVDPTRPESYVSPWDALNNQEEEEEEENDDMDEDEEDEENDFMDEDEEDEGSLD